VTVKINLIRHLRFCRWVTVRCFYTTAASLYQATRSEVINLSVSKIRSATCIIVRLVVIIIINIIIRSVANITRSSATLEVISFTVIRTGFNRFPRPNQRRCSGESIIFRKTTIVLSTRNQSTETKKKRNKCTHLPKYCVEIVVWMYDK